MTTNRVGPRPAGILLFAVLLAACQTTTPGVTKRPVTRTAEPSAAVLPLASDAPAPSPGASGVVIPRSSPTVTLASPTAPGTVALLKPPVGTSTTLSGKITIDAGYAVTRGGTLLSEAGASVVVPGGGQIVAGGSGNVVAGGGGNVIASGAGNVIAGGGGNISALGGGNIVAGGSGNIVAGGSGNIVAGGSGNIVAGGSGNYRVLATEATATPGALLPAVGMLVGVVDLATGAYVPVGIDGRGQPVYTVYTNAEGRYTLYLRTALTTNVRVLVRPAAGEDPRLAYDFVTRPQVGTTVDDHIDEDNAQIARYIRVSYQGRLAGILRQLIAPTPPTNAALVKGLAAGAKLGGLDPVALLTPLLDQMRAAVKEIALTEPQVDRAAYQMADAVLANLGLAALNVDPLEYTKRDGKTGFFPVLRADAPGYPHAGEPLTAQDFALTELTAVLKHVREHVAGVLAEQPGPIYFPDEAAFKAKGFEVRKASDVAEFIVAYDFTDEAAIADRRASQIFIDTGLPAAVANAHLSVIYAANRGVGYALVQRLLDEQVTASAIAALKRHTQDP